MKKNCTKLGRNCYFYDECFDSKINANIKYNKDDIFSADNIENILLNIGIKKVKKIENINIKFLEKVINRYRKNFYYGVYSFNDEMNILGMDLNKKSYILLLSKYNKYIIDFIKYDHSIKTSVIGTGLLLGYPKCCINNHNISISGCPSNIKSISEDKNGLNKIFNNGIKCKLLNPFLKLYAHMPCSNNCLNTISIAEKILIELESIYGKRVVEYYFSEININA